MDDNNVYTEIGRIQRQSSTCNFILIAVNEWVINCS